ncbi:MAG: hypothetical protein AAGC92_16380 [Pseudomonadota bacterium]
MAEREKPPHDLDPNPEWTAEDTARAKRGAPWMWDAAVSTARSHVGSALEALQPLRGEDRLKIEGALQKLQDAMADLERAGK